MTKARIAALALCATLTAAGEGTPRVLAHHGPWNVHTSENACLLARTFGQGAEETSVGFQPLFTTETGELLLISNDKGAERTRGQATITQLPSGRTHAGEYFSTVLAAKGKRATRITVPRAVWDGLSDTDVLQINAAPVSVRVKLVRFAAAKSAFDKCERDLLAQWKIDPVMLESNHAPVPTKKVGTYFRWTDYPSSAIQGGHVGRVVAILDVSASGSVTGCRIGSTSWPDLNEATCRGARRMRFRPGHDASGNVAGSIFLLPVRWSFEDR